MTLRGFWGPGLSIWGRRFWLWVEVLGASGSGPITRMWRGANSIVALKLDPLQGCSVAYDFAFFGFWAVITYRKPPPDFIFPRGHSTA